MSVRTFGRALPLLILTSAGGAAAAPPGGTVGGDDNAVSYAPEPSVRRDGFAMAMSSSFGLSHATGFENSVASISDPDNRQSTGFELGNNFTLWLGGALRDWLSVGLGFSSTATLTGNPVAANPSFILHVEGFPLFYRGGTWQDLGIAIEGGLGVGYLLDPDRGNDQKPLADGGSMSSLGVSVFYEPLRFWNFSAGPSLSYLHSFSQSMTTDHVLLGFRLSLYGVVPKPKKGEARATSSASLF